MMELMRWAMMMVVVPEKDWDRLRRKAASVL